MKCKFLFLSFSLMFALGCASSRPPTALNQLEIKVAHMERELDQKEQEIRDLRYQMDGLVDSVQTQRQQPRVQETVKASSTVVKEQASVEASKSNDIIRVSASPEDIQTALQKAGFYNGKVDGKIGLQSQKAIADFQESQNLEADGIVGKRTWNALKGYLE